MMLETVIIWLLVTAVALPLFFVGVAWLLSALGNGQFPSRACLVHAYGIHVVAVFGLQRRCALRTPRYVRAVTLRRGLDGNIGAAGWRRAGWGFG